MDATALDTLSQLGTPGLALGAVFVLWRVHVSGIARERQTTDYERARADKAEERAQRLEDSMRTEVIPVMTRVVDVMGRVGEVVAEVAVELRRPRS